MAAAAAVVKKTVQVGAFKQWMHLASGYCKLGLYTDDMLDTQWFPHFEEALNRLPKDLKMERANRVTRAITLSMNHHILPKEEWISAEEDLLKGRYLKPYIAEVLKENEDKKMFQ